MNVKKWFWGAFFIAGAGLIIASSMGVFAGVSLWSLVLTILLAAVIVGSIFHFNFFGIIMPIACLGIIYAKPLGITAITPWPILVAGLLASIGLSVIFGHGKKLFLHWDSGAYSKDFNYEIDGESIDDGDGSDHFDGGTSVNNVDGPSVQMKVSFSSGVRYIRSQELKRVGVDCSFGEMVIYFDQANLAEGGADVRVNCSFGEIQLFVPRHWRVQEKVSGSFSGFKNDTRYCTATEDSPTLYLGGSVSFGELKVNYV